MPKRIFLTVDTECHNIELVNQYIYGKTGNKEYGIKKILELAKEHNIIVNFFVDIVEARKYGDIYIQNIIELIKQYNQPIYLHLHPDYVSGDSRSFLWEYSYHEQKDIILKGIEDYKKFIDVNKGDNIVFRAGRYGVNEDTYKILSELDNNIVDLSYIYDGRKMCKISSSVIGTINRPVKFHDVTVLPNIRYIAFDYFNKKKSIGLDLSDSTYSEFKDVVSLSELNNLVLTMHSWSLIKKWFFMKHYITGDKFMVNKFAKCVNFAKKKGYVFDDIKNFEFNESNFDEILNLCSGLRGKFKGFINNFIRFQKIGRLNPKYFILYLIFYFVLISLVLFIIGALI